MTSKFDIIARFIRMHLRFEKEEHEHDTYVEIKAGGEFSGYNFWILGIAMIIACIGLNADSISAIIGAMLISPLMGPIICFSTGLAIGDAYMRRVAFRNWIWMTMISLMASSLYFYLTPIQHNTSSLNSFTKASLFDLFIAFFGGLAGFVGIAKKDGTKVLAGVSVATACMPPLCTAGFGIAHGDFSVGLGGLYFYFINCLFIGLATFLMSRFYGMHVYYASKEKLSRTQKGLWYLLILGMFLPAGLLFYQKWKSEANVVYVEDDTERLNRMEEQLKVQDSLIKKLVGIAPTKSTKK